MGQLSTSVVIIHRSCHNSLGFREYLWVSHHNYTFTKTNEQSCDDTQYCAQWLLIACLLGLLLVLVTSVRDRSALSLLTILFLICERFAIIAFSLATLLSLSQLNGILSIVTTQWNSKNITAHSWLNWFWGHLWGSHHNWIVTSHCGSENICEGVTIIALSLTIKTAL